jgi:hypothetical protein
MHQIEVGEGAQPVFIPWGWNTETTGWENAGKRRQSKIEKTNRSEMEKWRELRKIKM